MYTVFCSGLDNPYDSIGVEFLSDAAEIWSQCVDCYAVVLDANGRRVPADVLMNNVNE